MYIPSETALFKACRTIFGKDVNLSREFLDYLQPGGVKTAFRTKAKTHHPDAHAGAPSEIRKKHSERFLEIRQAHDLIITFLEKRHSNRTGSEERSAEKASSHWGNRTSRRQRPRQKPYAQPLTVPSIPLEFGMFTYYKGKVSYHQLIQALVWQRRQRPTLGAIAQKWGWLSEDRICHIMACRGQVGRFGNKAIELGYLQPHQVEIILQHQRVLQKRIGQYFVAEGILTSAETDALARQLNLHNQSVKKRNLAREANSR